MTLRHEASSALFVADCSSIHPRVHLDYITNAMITTTTRRLRIDDRPTVVDSSTDSATVRLLHSLQWGVVTTAA